MQNTEQNRNTQAIYLDTFTHAIKVGLNKQHTCQYNDYLQGLTCLKHVMIKHILQITE